MTNLMTYEVGFTGSQKGIAADQTESLDQLLKNIYAVHSVDKEMWLHHGDCVGADAVVHNLCKPIGYHRSVHPPTEGEKRAYCKTIKDHDWLHDELTYMIRNQMIVNAAQVLIACPNSFVEHLRSGTWSTIRKARKKGIPVYIIQPDGKVV